MKAWPFLLLATSLVAHAGEYQSATEKDAALVIVSQHGSLTAPLTEKDQVGFTQVRISDDGMTVGWVTLVSCCASYPYPTSLVLFQNGKVVRQFHDLGVTNDWMFVGNASVAYQEGLPHGSEDLEYFQRRINDGKLVATFSCGRDPKTGEMKNSGPVPDWVNHIAGDCP